MADFPVVLTAVVDGSTDVMAKHLNNLEAKVGVDGSAVTTSLDYLLKLASDPGHTHTAYDPAGSAAAITPTTLGLVIGTNVLAYRTFGTAAAANVGDFQAPIGFTPENPANKSTTLDTDKASNTKYSSVKSIYDWAVGLFATITNLALKAPLASPTFTGTPSLPTGTTATTQSANDNSTKIATTAYVDAKPAGGNWVAVTGTRVSDMTFTVPGDQTAIFKKGLIIMWTDTTPQIGVVSIPSTVSTNTTVTMIGDLCGASATAFKYSLIGAEAFVKRFASAGNLGSVTTNIMNTFTAMEPYRVLGADISVGAYGTTNSTTFDININGTSCFTTKPTLATTVRYSPTPFTANDNTSLALGDAVTVDLDAIQVTNAQDGYIELIVIPTRYLYIS